jgi:hypothetical protein
MLYVPAVKAIVVQASGGPYGFRKSRLSEFLDSQHVEVLRLSALSTVHLYSQIELTPGPQRGRKNAVSENFRHHRESNSQHFQADYSKNSDLYPTCNLKLQSVFCFTFPTTK